jgi:murein DD-endopeptidase MepM/ murein hydrolase activator NlpD
MLAALTDTRLAPIVALLFLAGLPSAPGADGNAIEVTPAARAVQPGELVVLTVTAPAAAERVSVSAFGREVPVVPVDANSWRALVGIDLDVEPGAHDVSIEIAADGATAGTVHTLQVGAADFPTRELRVDAAYVDPPASVRQRIGRDAAALARAWRSSAAEPLWSGPFLRPVDGALVSSFGKRSILNGKPRGAHGGADFRGAAGTPVHAPNAGRVVLARDLYYSGNTVVIDHGLRLFSLFAHLSAFDVAEGDRVDAGVRVGRIGATGRVTGPHLHWAVRVGGARVDPMSLLALLGPESVLH